MTLAAFLLVAVAITAIGRGRRRLVASVPDTPAELLDVLDVLDGDRAGI